LCRQYFLANRLPARVAKENCQVRDKHLPGLFRKHGIKGGKGFDCLLA
jgi:hypothetical protein